ncbi:hypothetical protein PG985_015137 [Apiospora marii]|uniref:Uncharacterized protein n=1 Tax=Apiospora marii TaxID=335849 RepID=A0ABR1RLY6_9PEZI
MAPLTFQSLSLKSVLLLAAALVPAVDAAGLLRRDPPKALPGCATDADKRFQPVMDFDKDGCYNSPAVDAAGTIATGLKCGGDKNGHCRDKSDLDNNNVYARARCNHGWCAHMYAYYFEKDQSVHGSCGVGHRHDWEHVTVWAREGADRAAYVAVSQHKGWEVRDAADVRFEGARPKVVYHQDGGLTHDFRFANEADDEVENHHGKWFVSAPSIAIAVYSREGDTEERNVPSLFINADPSQSGALLSWNGLPDTVRTALVNGDFGAAYLNFKDEGGFSNKLKDAKGDKDISLDVSSDNENSPGTPQC